MGASPKTHLIILGILVAASFLVPHDGWVLTAIKVGGGWLTAASIVTSVRRHTPSVPAAWYLFAVGVWANATGILVEAILTRVADKDTYPSIADGFWLTLYPALLVGMALLLRHRNSKNDWAGAIDAATISTGLGLLSWIYLIKPATDANLGSDPAQVIAIAYPVADLIVLSMLIRLLMDCGSRNTSFALMIGSMSMFLLGDLGWALSTHLGTDPPPVLERVLDAIFLTAYGVFATAAAHRSVRAVGEQRRLRPARLSMPQLGLLTTASLTAPTVLLVEATQGDITDGVAISICCGVLFVLVVFRMAQLLREVESQARALDDLARIDDLTGLANRRSWDADVDSAMIRARRDETVITVALIDIDHFKQFNDRFGHPRGDELLKQAAVEWRRQIRDVDQLARYGGEEFVVLFVDASLDDVADVLTRLRSVTPMGQTFSGGIATWNRHESRADLVARADQALYRAKNGGRDRLCLAEAGLVS